MDLRQRSWEPGRQQELQACRTHIHDTPIPPPDTRLSDLQIFNVITDEREQRGYIIKHNNRIAKNHETVQNHSLKLCISTNVHIRRQLAVRAIELNRGRQIFSGGCGHSL